MTINDLLAVSYIVVSWSVVIGTNLFFKGSPL